MAAWYALVHSTLAAQKTLSAKLAADRDTYIVSGGLVGLWGLAGQTRIQYYIKAYTFM